MESHKDSNSSSVPVAIIVGSVLISLSILMGTGVIKIKGYTPTGMAAQTGNPVAPTQAQAQPTVAPIVDVEPGHFPIKGNKDAKVTIIEFADFRCPFCEKIYTDTIPQIMKDYVDTGKAKFAYRQFAFLGPASTTAANAAECANEQGKFWEFHDNLFDNQPPESDVSIFTTDKLTSIAQGLGVNASQFKSCLESTKYNDKVTQDMTDGQAAGVTGTPTLFINGQSIVGAQPYSAIKAIIDQKLAEK
jgi:protein-disulfide isomerase